MQTKVWILVLVSALFLVYFVRDSEKEPPATESPRIAPAETGGLKENAKATAKEEPPEEKQTAVAPKEEEEQEEKEPPKDDPVKVAKAEPVSKGGGEPESAAEKLSYVLGLDVGSSLRDLETEIDLKQFSRGVEDMLLGRNPSVKEEEASLIKQDFADRKEAERSDKEEELRAKNDREGKAFLEKNKDKPGVVTTESGLQYLVITEGSGPRPGPRDRVRVDYRGTLLDGTEFDSSYTRGAPSVFSLTSVIPGWSEALAFMPEGSKYRLFIPPNLAYGEHGAGRQIGPNATLIYEVELISIVK